MGALYYLVEKMLSRIKKTKYGRYGSLTYLEPSAGKGAIAEELALKIKSNDGYNSEKPRIDVIEIEPELQCILKNNDAVNLVHNDFLTFDTYKFYDVLIMNPPFSQGDKHLMKAITLQERLGGQIICLLNAETLKNPYTNLRKEIMDKLNHYEAEIEYIQDAFIDAERKTSVEVALISIDIPSIIKVDESMILEKMEKAKEYASKDDDDNSLISGNEIKGICESYRYAVEAGVCHIEEHYRLNAVLFSAEKGTYDKSTLLISVEGENKSSSENQTKNELINAYIEAVRLKFWKKIFDSKAIYELVTNDVYYSLSEMIHSMKDYDVSEFNAYQLQRKLMETLNDNVEGAIEKTFDELTKYADDGKNTLYYNGWKTNTAWKVGKKAIIRLDGFCSYTKRLDFNHTLRTRIDELQKVLTYLCNGNKKIDGSEIVERLNRAQAVGHSKKIDFEYFELTFYKRGTCHIEFNDEKLIERLNIFVGKKRNWLPPVYGKKEYYNMSEEEKDTIRSFQDELSYERCRKDEAVQRILGDGQCLLEMGA